jgi:DNA repair protein RadC
MKSYKTLSHSQNPSESVVTKKMAEAGKIIDITVLDHLIITQTSYFSFSDEGRL